MSFQFDLSPKDIAAIRFVPIVRRALQKAFNDFSLPNGVNKAEIARRLGVHRSVVTRMLSGKKALTTRSVAELAWAMGCEPEFKLTPITSAAFDVEGNGYGSTILSAIYTSPAPASANTTPPQRVVTTGTSVSAVAS